jgi:hypothetical protein
MVYFFRVLPPLGVGREVLPMLAWPRVLAARSLFGLLAPPKAPELDDCGRLVCCEPDGLAAGWVVDAGVEAGCVDAAGRDPCMLPVEGRVSAVLPVG